MSVFSGSLLVKPSLFMRDLFYCANLHVPPRWRSRSRNELTPRYVNCYILTNQKKFFENSINNTWCSLNTITSFVFAASSKNQSDRPPGGGDQDHQKQRRRPGGLFELIAIIGTLLKCHNIELIFCHSCQRFSFKIHSSMYSFSREQEVNRRAKGEKPSCESLSENVEKVYDRKTFTQRRKNWLAHFHMPSACVPLSSQPHR